MKVSIITVCYNSEKTIRSTIESVLAQSYPDIEYIVVDGSSTDSTMEILSEYSSQITRIVSEPDLGIYDAMNKGLELATGDLLGILNSDDYYETADSVLVVADHFRSSGCDIVFGDVVFVKPGNLDKITRHYRAGQFKPWMLRFGWMPPHPATFISRKAYQSGGRYSLSYRIAADYDMFVRLLLVKKLKISRLDRVLVRMRSGGLSTSGVSNSMLLNREIVEACRSNGVYTNIFFVLSKIPFKFLELIVRAGPQR